METNRLLKYLASKRIVALPAEITKLDSQGLSGQVYSVDSNREHYVLKFYRDKNEKKVSKVASIYKHLSNFGVPVPKVYFVDAKGEIVRKPFLLMQKLKGEKFSSLLKTHKGKEFVEALALTLHKLHSIDVKNFGLHVPSNAFKETASEIKVAAQILLSFSMAPLVFQKIYTALSKISRRPVKGNTLALLHGDCGPDNVIYSNGTVYLIDLESAQIGDPAYDLGYAYHAIKLGAPSDPWLAEHFIESYEKLHGEIADLETYKKLSALKLAVFLRLLRDANLLSLTLLGLKKTLNLLAVRKQFSFFLNYCLTYAEKAE